MANAFDYFLFDVNFGLGDEPLLSNVDNDNQKIFPPIVGFFLLLNGGNFLLLNGQNLDLL